MFDQMLQSRRFGHRRRAVGIVLVLLAQVITPIFLAPTEAPIVERFDHDAGRYGPGNRGISFETPAGSVVSAIGDGVVTFAGPVAGTVWVTVMHTGVETATAGYPAGLRSTVGPMASIDVAAGEQVIAGQRLGTSAGRVGLTIRDGDTYLDPEPFIARVRMTARLVPVPPR